MRVMFNGVLLADSDNAQTVEGNHYFPRGSVKMEYFSRSDTPYTCPWKGQCTYYNLTVGDTVLEDVAWSYEHPKPAASNIAGHLAFDNRLSRS